MESLAHTPPMSAAKPRYPLFQGLLSVPAWLGVAWPSELFRGLFAGVDQVLGFGGFWGFGFGFSLNEALGHLELKSRLCHRASPFASGPCWLYASIVLNWISIGGFIKAEYEI